jgi:imidazolonepropionase-like amidohydrolase
MRNALPSLLTILLLLSLDARGQREPEVQQRPLVFTNATVLDMTGAAAKSEMTVVVARGRITAAGKSSNVRIPKNARVVDAKGEYLIPGLWDMHVHIFNNSSRPGTNKKDWYFPLLIANGVTGVRDMWTDPDDLKLVRQWQRDIQAGDMLGPRIAPSSSIVDGVPTHLPNMLGVSTPEEARRAVRMLKDAGAGFIKVYWNLSPEAYYAIVDEAKKLGIPVAGHVPYSISAAAASDAGQKSIEHMTGVFDTCSTKEAELQKARELTPALAEEMWRTQDEQKCLALFRRFAQNGTWHAPTIALHRMLAFLSDEDFKKDPRLRYIPSDTVQDWLKPAREGESVDLETRKARFQKMLEYVGAMHRAGVRLLAGTDIGNPFLFPGFSLHDELELFVQAGLTPLEALKTATVNPAKYLGLSSSLGTIEKGKVADLVLLEANPLANIRNTQKIAAVVVNGSYISKPDLQKMVLDVEAAAKKK